MKVIVNIYLALLLSISGIFAQKSIVVTNSSDLNRNGELVEMKIDATKNNKLRNPFILKNEKGEEVGYQLLRDDMNEIIALLFQADVKAKSSNTYSILEGKPAAVKAKTFGRQIPERKDDFAWENDFAGYRMYGPGLVKENPSNGIDFWAKKTDDLIVNEFYEGELKHGKSYHRDRGRGLDFYKVGHTLGCGGIAPYMNETLWVGNHYDHFKVNEDGPLRTIFTLIYDSLLVGNEYYKHTITITADAGSLMNKAEVTYIGKPQKMQLAAGIFLHDGKGDIKNLINSECFILCKSDGYLTYTENAVSEFKEPSGRNYVGVFMDVNGKLTDKKTTDHSLMLADYTVGKKFSYYFGAGWNSWKFPTDKDWVAAVDNFSQTVKKPLKAKFVR
jgi:hypothetical protein